MESTWSRNFGKLDSGGAGQMYNCLNNALADDIGSVNGPASVNSTMNCNGFIAALSRASAASNINVMCAKRQKVRWRLWCVVGTCLFLYLAHWQLNANFRYRQRLCSYALNSAHMGFKLQIPALQTLKYVFVSFYREILRIRYSAVGLRTDIPGDTERLATHSNLLIWASNLLYLLFRCLCKPLLVSQYKISCIFYSTLR